MNRLNLTTLFIVIAAGSSLLANDEARPGISGTRPESGPFVAVEGGFMVPYNITIPGTELTVEMIPIPGGEFLMGSPESESGRKEDEGPQRTVSVSPFWMAKHEVTWAEYKEFMRLYRVFKEFVATGVRRVTDENRIDAITAPTPLYEPDFTWEFGEEAQQAAVSMDQYAAKQYSKWLSIVLDQQLRLPTEAEWEYACRAGTTTAYSFGDDASKMDEYAWFAGNTDEDGQRYVGLKKPNPWGLHDMHGNVAEWVLDGYAAYEASDKQLVAHVDWVRPVESSNRVVRGGSWEMPAEQCRSSSRLASDNKEWKDYDPNLPKSPWWNTNDPVRGVGFRLIRPLHQLSREDMEQFWKIDARDLQYDVEDRLAEGRGVLGLIDKELTEEARKLDLP